MRHFFIYNELLLTIAIIYSIIYLNGLIITEEFHIMDMHYKELNRSMIFGWLLIVSILFVTYTIEVFTGYFDVPYLVVFLAVTVIPAVAALLLYLRKPDMKQLCYFVVCGYSVMYTFVMITGQTPMVWTYILPMLSLLVLYHKPKLILVTGGATLIVNLISIIYRWLHDGANNFETTEEIEIQLVMVSLSFIGSYIAARIYDGITKQNEEYLDKLNQQNEQIQNMTTQTITTIVNALDAKDSYSEGHSRRVAVYSAQIAEKLGFSKDDVRNIHIIALLHDIGKIGVPDSVLNKPGRLTDEEYNQMKQHAVVGSEILKDIDLITGIDIGTKYHHERYDGRGYPEGLKGEDIPYIARIIAVADAYDAMTSNRVYRKHLSYDQVMSELVKGEGTQFDPAIAKAMEDLLKEGKLANISPDMEIVTEDEA